ncbi:FadR/GntR family transcriptional regulator [Herbaspirillum lusitanum]|jgi:DNA-binding FadR family transcriptional regulator|uniref:FadR/GntR family transcriptional regulator n=1 Tax=Herbaspirillum lusitanum TaxID=213312 RepID=A0ABW9AHL7_9BURK
MTVSDSPSPLIRPRRKAQSLSQEVVAAISEMIAKGQIKPGDKLPTESEIMQSQGVSRTVVREAISRLQAAGQVETRHGIGTFVLEAKKGSNINIDPATITTMKDLLALLELRISLETETAGLAAARRTDAQLKEIRLALDAFKDNLAKGGDTVGPDFRFHFQIANATGNRYFIEILSHLGAGVIPRKRLNTAELARDPQASYLDRVQREHEDIYEAIARGDSEAARAAMRNHLTNSRERLRRAQIEAEAGASAQTPQK